MAHRTSTGFCEGRWESFVIWGHGFSFMRCSKCGAYLGGKRTKTKIDRLMQIKVSPEIRRH